MPRKLKPGDVCQLNSGGPLMTVDHEAQDGSLVCKWFHPAALPGSADDALDYHPAVWVQQFARKALSLVPIDASDEPGAAEG